MRKCSMHGYKFFIPHMATNPMDIFNPKLVDDWLVLSAKFASFLNVSSGTAYFSGIDSDLGVCCEYLGCICYRNRIEGHHLSPTIAQLT